MVAICVLAWLPASHFNKLVHSGMFIGTTDLEHAGVKGRGAVVSHPLWHSKWTHLYLLETQTKEQPNQVLHATSEPAP